MGEDNYGIAGSRGLFSIITNLGKTVPRYFTNIIDIGDTDYVSSISKNMAVPRSETEMQKTEMNSLFGADRRNIRYHHDVDVPFFRSDYRTRLKEIHKIASNSEVQSVIEWITSDAISYDIEGKYCDINISPKYSEDIRNNIKFEFDRLYSNFGFSNGYKATRLFETYLKEGYLAFEIKYDNILVPTRVEDISEIDPATLIPYIQQSTVTVDGIPVTRDVKMWKQISKDSRGIRQERTIQDNQIVFISYSKGRYWDKYSKMSYIDKLVRSFNMMRNMENASVMWYMMNARSRMSVTIPTGSQNFVKSLEYAEQWKARYHEEVNIDHDSGEVFVQGKRNIPWTRTVAIPSREGSQEPRIESTSYQGVDLSRMDGVEYFRNKFRIDSNLPMSRFESDRGSGSKIIFQADNTNNDEIRYFNMVKSMKKEFDKILMKPLLIQMMMNYPQLKYDRSFKSSISLRYPLDDELDLARSMESKSKKLRLIQDLERATRGDGSRLYSAKYLYVNMFNMMTEEEWEQNRKMIEEEKGDDNNDDSGSSGRGFF